MALAFPRGARAQRGCRRRRPPAAATLAPRGLGWASAVATGLGARCGGSGAAPGPRPRCSGGEGSVWAVHGLRPRWGSGSGADRRAQARCALPTWMRREEQTTGAGPGQSIPGSRKRNAAEAQRQLGKVPGTGVSLWESGAVPTGGGSVQPERSVWLEKQGFASFTKRNENEKHYCSWHGCTLTRDRWRPVRRAS